MSLCDHPDAPRAGTIFMEMQDSSWSREFISLGYLENYNSESYVQACVYVSVPMHAEVHCVFNIIHQA